MISRIRGTILEKNAQEVVVDVSGVGYELHVPLSTVFELPEVGSEAIFHTHFIVREDAQLLFGFADQKERELFRVLIKVNGVGPKVALNILSGMSAAELVQCVQKDDVASLVRVPGIGRKTAERLLVDVRDKLVDWLPSDQNLDGSGMGAAVASDQEARDAESALTGLGYKMQEAVKAVDAARRQLEADARAVSSDALVRLALRNMA